MLGGDQEAWPNAILNLKTEEKMDYGRRYRAQVGSLTGWVKKKVVSARNRPVSARKTCETPSRSLLMDYELKGWGRCVYFTQSFSGHPCGPNGDPGARMT